jgi:NAD(P)-dependent dehydrogenase (short-subunit alcohol dehydrogenase family)
MPRPRVLVTGSSRGVGRAIALRLAREQAHVVVAARNATELDRVVAEVNAAGGRGEAAQLDLGDHGSVEAGVWRALQFLDGAVDLLVHAASTCAQGPLGDLDIARWKRSFEVGVDGPMFVTRECLEALREGERPLIVFVVSPRTDEAGRTAASATSGASRGLAAALREELAPVRVTTILRGAASTDADVADAVWRAWTAADPIPDLDLTR